MSFVRSRGLSLALLLAVSVSMMGFGAARGAESPLDEKGLPIWVERQYDDFPVLIQLENTTALEELLTEVPLASWHREQIRLVPDTPFGAHVEFTPRVTDRTSPRTELTSISSFST